MNYTDPLKPFVLISASRAAWSAEANADSTRQLASQLLARDFEITQVRGSYGGIEEDSFLVLCDPETEHYRFDMLKQLAKRYGQESILVVDAERSALLRFMDERVSAEPLPGKFQAVDSVTAHKLHGWTRREGQYYAVLWRKFGSDWHASACWCFSTSSSRLSTHRGHCENQAP